MSRDEIYLELCRAVKDAPFYVFGDEDQLKHAHFPNAYRLLIGFVPQLEALVRMCNADGAGVSDYEKFEEICSAFPMLVCSTAHSAVRELLSRLFDCNLSLNKENAPKIWSACCGDGFGIGGREIMDALNVKCIPVCQISNIKDKAQDTNGLSELCREACSNISSAGGLLSVSLPDGFEFAKPSVYGVDAVLAKLNGGAEISACDRNMLAVQILRSLMPEMQECKMPVLLYANADRNTDALIKYLNDSVGLADILFVAKDSTAELKRFIYALPPELLVHVLPAGAEEASAEDALRGYMRVFPIENLPHLGFLSDENGFANVAEQCALRRSLCMLLADAVLGEDEIQRARVTARRVCFGNISDIAKARSGFEIGQ